MSKNILKGTTTYLVGPMQYGDGSVWREKVEERLKNIGIRVFNPYKHPFVNSIDEGIDLLKTHKELIEKKEYDKIAELWKKTRREDLAMCDYSTFIFAYINLNTYTVGSYEEIFWSNRLKRPIFLVCEQGKDKVPGWLWGTIPHKYFYNSIEEALQMIELINSGDILIDSDRWRILKPEYQ